jgi:hypothetical protein
METSLRAKQPFRQCTCSPPNTSNSAKHECNKPLSSLDVLLKCQPLENNNIKEVSDADVECVSEGELLDCLGDISSKVASENLS